MSLPIGPSRELLNQLLYAYNEHPELREATLREINERFNRRLAVMIVDTCSFSKTVQDRGVIYFLALLERLQRIIDPYISECQGRLLRTEADNFYAAFSSVDDAVQCAASIVATLERVNEPMPRPDEMHVSIGIGYGEMLVVGSHDLFGDEMNLACKLGEDIAEAGEVLLTNSARSTLDIARWRTEPLEVATSGVSIQAHRLLR